MAAIKPLITAFKDEEFYEGTTPPVLFAFTEEEIYERIKQAYQMSVQELNEMGERGYNFAMQWHEQTKTIDTHINILKEVIASIKK